MTEYLPDAAAHHPADATSADGTPADGGSGGRTAHGHDAAEPASSPHPPAAVPAPDRAAYPRLTPLVAAGHHLLLLAADVEPDELPTLVTSLVVGAAWDVPPTQDLPGVLDLLAEEHREPLAATLAATLPATGAAADASGTCFADTGGQPPASARATLTGPWRVDLRTRHELDLPEWVDRAWVIDVEPERSAPAPEIEGGYGELLDAFGANHPIGVERQVLDVALACARRLAAALRTDGGVLLEPDPASAVDLSVYSPTWLEPDALHQVLVGRLPGLELMPGVDPVAHSRLDGYGAAWYPEGAHGCLVLLEVEAVELLPAALASLGWTASGVIAYHARWVTEVPEREPDTRAGLRHRQHVSGAVAQAALALHEAVGGVILDEDGFLVLPEQLA